MSDISELIDRLRGMPSPSFELEREINLAVFGQHALPMPPAYTASIDAALMLLVPGWEYTISTLYGQADVELPLNDTRITPVRIRRTDGNVPLAIATAALEARAAIAKAEGSVSP